MLTATLFLLATAAGLNAQLTFPDTTVPLSVDATSYLSLYYSPSPIPTQITGAVATSLASGLYSVDLSFASDPKGAASVNSDIWSAAAKATDAAQVTASFEKSGWYYDQITTAAWYKDNMPDGAKSEVSEYVSMKNSVFDKVLSVTTTKSDNGAAPACTGMAMAAAGVAVGVAALL